MKWMLMNTGYSLIILVFFLTFSMIFFHSFKFMNVLLYMEMISIIAYFMSVLILGSLTFSFMLYFLIMSVCEGVLGLTLVVVVVETYGKTCFKNVNLSLC